MTNDQIIRLEALRMATRHGATPDLKLASQLYVFLSASPPPKGKSPRVVK